MNTVTKTRLASAVALVLVTTPLAHGSSAQINIVSPDNKAVVRTHAIYVSGNAVASSRNIAVTVNGVAADIDLSRAGTKNDPFRWFAVLEPSTSGTVKLTARLHLAGNGSDDENAASVRHVEFLPPMTRTRLSVSPAGGIVPLGVEFHVQDG